ncbi:MULTISPECIES: transporter substrate-binding domain-containing protein [Rhizobium/Agrobacterium group]|uniref:transporter substrate-binding domain-containing protein n=1 Tax=Rhizobium/Agrobacterium group TaxID=227290 RepID=UPI000A015FAE|nr:transporter substrate-binding domain-containing protein [Rhizobium nepotum]
MTFGKMKRKAELLGAVASVCFAMAGSSGAAHAQELPRVPSAIQEQGKVRVGTKCDYPPEGYLDNAGTPVGVEVAMGHQIAKYSFGENAVAEIVCVTSANRVPALLGNKVDLLIATMAIDPERAKVVDFTEPYAWASQGVVVRADSPYKTVSELDGKPVAFVKGAVAITYFKESHPTVEQLQLDGVSDSIQALMQNRVEAYAHDTPVLLSLVSKNAKLRLLNENFKVTQRAAAVRPGEKEWLAFVNASLAKMAKEGRFREWFTAYANDADMETKLNFWDMSKKPTK